MKNLFVVSLLTSVLLHSASCGAPQADVAQDASSQGQKIVGGVATKGFPAVGILYDTAADGMATSLCTASLVAPRTLLTAAHCVMAVDSTAEPLPQVASARSLYFYAGPDAAQQDASQIYNAQAIILPGGSNFPVAAFVSNVRNHVLNDDDIALVILQTAPNIQPLPISSLRMDNSYAGYGLTLVGYGNSTNYHGTDSGLKRTTTTTITGMYDPYLMVAGTTGASTCSGDSGGPALHDGAVLGVVQAGPISRNGTCLGNDYFTRIDSWTSFILANAR